MLNYISTGSIRRIPDQTSVVVDRKGTHNPNCKMRKSWIKIRKIGKRNFIITLSLLLGLLTAGFSAIVHMVIDNHYDFSLFYSGGSLGMFVGGTLGWLLFSYSQWEINENKFKKQNDG
jgi:hypothetical protein